MLPILLACATQPPEAPVKGNLTEVKRADNSRPTAVAGLNANTSATGLTWWVLKEGTGAVPTPGQTVAVHYTGWLKSSGEKFDSSLDRGKTFTFPVGQGRVIPGWDEAVGAMKVGEHRMLEIPPQLAYGERGAGGVIPPGATLLFDVELIEVR